MPSIQLDKPDKLDKSDSQISQMYVIIGDMETGIGNREYHVEDGLTVKSNPYIDAAVLIDKGVKRC